MSWARWKVSGRTEPSISRAVRADNLTYLSREALTDLYDRVQQIETNHITGQLIEAGCALGGSGIVMAAAKSPTRPLHIYDVFGMIPPPSDRDGHDVHERYNIIRSGKSSGIGGGRYYGYEDGLRDKVKENFVRHGFIPSAHRVFFVKGLFQDTMNIEESVALAHIDGDWYESVLTCLQRIEPHLSVGGALVVDDYDAWSGCRTAVDQYFSDKRDQYDFLSLSRLHIVRRR